MSSNENIAEEFLKKASLRRDGRREVAMKLSGWEQSDDRGFCPEALALHEALNEGLRKTGEAGWSSNRKSDATMYIKMLGKIIDKKCNEESESEPEPEPDEIITDEELNAKLLSFGLSGIPDTLPDTSFERQMVKDEKKLITQALLNTYLLKKRNQIIKESSNGLNAYLLRVYKFYIYALKSLKDSEFTDKPKIFNGILANIDLKNVMDFFIPNHIRNITGQEMSFPITTDNNYYKCFEKIMEYKKGRGSKTEKLIAFEDDITKFQQMVNNSLGENGHAVNIHARSEQKAETSRQDEKVDSAAFAASEELSGAMGEVADAAIDLSVQVPPAMNTLAAISEGRSDPSRTREKPRKRRSGCGPFGCGSKSKGGAAKKRNKTNRKKVIRSKHKKYKRTKKGKKNKKTKRR